MQMMKLPALCLLLDVIKTEVKRAVGLCIAKTQIPADCQFASLEFKLSDY